MSDAQIEQEIQAKGLTAARVTPADVEANIASEFYFTATEGVLGASGMGTAPAGRAKSLDLLTFCVLVLQNGFVVTGESACASPENFDAEVGRKIARQNAVQKIWPLMGYELRTKLAGLTEPVVTDDMVNRFLQWPVPAHVHPDGTPGQPGRSGTNLLDAETARQMLSRVLSRV